MHSFRCQIPPPVVPQSKHTKDSKAVSYNFGPKASSKVVEDIEEEQAYDGAQEFDTAQDDGAFEYEEYAPESFALTKRSWPTAVVGIVSALGGVVLGLTIAAIAVVMAIMSIHW